MADTNATTHVQESDDVDNIPDDVLQRFLDTGQPQDLPEPEIDEPETEEEDPQPTVRDDGTAKSIEATNAALQKLTELVTTQHVANQRKEAPAQPAEPPTVDQVREILAKKGFGEDTVDVFAEVIAEASETIADKKTAGLRMDVQNLQGALQKLATNTEVSKLDSYTERMLDQKGITDAETRSKIIGLTKWDTMQKQNASMDDYVRNFERHANFFVDQTVAAVEKKDKQREIEDEQTPPPGGRGQVGFADVTRKMLKSENPNDRPGGDNWLKLVTNMIRSGGAV